MRIKYSPDASRKLKEMRKYVGQKVSKLTYFLHVDNYYIFYKVEKGIVFISDIYSEREDFMGKLFGINLRTQESQDYWGE